MPSGRGEGAVREMAQLPSGRDGGEDAGEAPARRAWLRQPESLFFLVLILLHLIPLWAFAYFPSQDGPAHLNNAQILRSYSTPDGALFRQYYEINPSPNPNWFGHLILAGLLLLTPPLVAEKLLLTAYVILLPLSVRYAARALRPDAGFVAVLALPFLYSYPLHMGFYYFCFSLAAFCFLLGYWARHQERVGLRQTVALTGLWLLLYFTHPVSLVMALLALGVLALCLTLLELARQGRQAWDLSGLGRDLASRLLLPLAACLPALVLILGFLGERGLGVYEVPELVKRMQRLWRLESLVSFRPVEGWLASGVVWLFTAALLYLLVRKLLRREYNHWDGLLLVGLAFVAVYALTPDRLASGAYLPERLMLYPFLALILWFAAQRWGRWEKWGLQGAAAAIAVGMLALHTTTYGSLDRYLREYTAGAERIEPNSTLLALSFSHWGDALDRRLRRSRIGTFRHASGYIGAERRILALHNYEANTGHFPLVFRPEVNPVLHISTHGESIEAQPPAVEFLTYPERTGGRVDYVLLWAAGDEQRENPDAASIFEQLEAGFEPVHTSPLGHMQLFRRRDHAPQALVRTGRIASP